MIGGIDFCIQLISYIGYIVLLILLGGRFGIWLHEIQGGFVKLGVKHGKISVHYETGIGFWSEREE